MAFALPNAYDVVVPQPEATGRLTVGFMRSPKRYKLTRYCQYIPVTSVVGLYRFIKSEASVRINDPNSMKWAYGTARAENSLMEQFERRSYRAERFNQTTPLDDVMIEQSPEDLTAEQAMVNANRLMLNRTVTAIDQLQTAGNWGANTATATALGGGKWDAATGTNLYIKQGITNAVKAIVLATNGVVQVSDLKLVLSPGAAVKISTSQEIRDLIKQSQYAGPELLRGTIEDMNFYLPPYLYGLEVVVEDTVRTLSGVDADGADNATKTFAWNDTVATIVARPGGLVGTYSGGPNYSTAVFFMKSENQVEQLNDPINRRSLCSVTDEWAFELVAPASGFCVTSIIN
jgi:hypothetical protein